MIYYKKKSRIKKILTSFDLFKRVNVKSDGGLEGTFIQKIKKLKQRVFSFLIFLAIVFLGIYLFLLYIIPNYINEQTIENAINTYILDDYKLSFDCDNLKIKTNYNFDINLKANYIKLNYKDTGKNFADIINPDISVNLVSFLTGFIDINKANLDKITINTTFLKSKKYNSFSYIFKDDKEKISKIKLRNINLNAKSAQLNLYDENIKKMFYIKADKLKLNSPELAHVLNISSCGNVISQNHKIFDFNLNLSIKRNPELSKSLKTTLLKLNYNPLKDLDKYKFNSKLDVNLKINPNNKKSYLSGYAKLIGYSFEINNIKLPKNDIILYFKDNKIKTDAQLNFIKNQYLKINSTVSLSKNKFIEAKLNSNEINISEINDFIKVFIKFFKPGLNLDDLDFSGLINVDLYLKSNFKTIFSNGKLNIKDAKIISKKLNLSIDSINSNINFDNNTIDIIDSSLFLNDAKFCAKGKIDNRANINITLNSDLINVATVLNLIKKIPLPSFYKEKLNDYDFLSGFIKSPCN